MFKQRQLRAVGLDEWSFNLLSEILFVQATDHLPATESTASFNLLSEILFVQAQPTGVDGDSP